MKATLIVLMFAAASMWGEIYFFQLLPYLTADLFFLSLIVMVLRWRGPEGYFIGAGLGLLADVYSSLPFGAHGVVFFALVWPIRWYAIKIFQGARITLPILTLVMVIVMNLTLLMLSEIIDPIQGGSWSWLWRMLVYEALPTMVLSLPFYVVLVGMDKGMNLRLAQRKF